MNQHFGAQEKAKRKTMSEDMRSFLFAPGHLWNQVMTSATAGADVFAIDLEDTVPPDAKEAARENLERAGRLAAKHKEVLFVRINGVDSEWWEQDVEAALNANAAGLWLPKCEAPETVRRVAELVEALENRKERAQAETGIELVPTLETPLGILKALEIAVSHERVRRLALGAYDLWLAMSLPGVPTERGRLDVPRWLFALAAHAAGVQAVDTAFGATDDIEGLVADAEDAHRIGFTAKACIHPVQVEPVNKVFTPSEVDVANAKEIITAFEDALAMGRGTTLVHGQFVDGPVARQAEALLKRSEALSRRAASRHERRGG